MRLLLGYVYLVYRIRFYFVCFLTGLVKNVRKWVMMVIEV